MNILPVLPILIPLTAAAASIPLWSRPVLQRTAGILGALGLLVTSCVLLHHVDHAGILSVQIGSWPAPFGITIVADRFSAIMTVLAGITGLAAFVYSVGGVDDRRKRLFYFPLLNLLLAGVCGAFLTGDLFNLYVWFEVLLMSSFVLMALGGERAQLEGSIKYVTLNLISSLFFLVAVGILYGAIGTLNMADIAMRVREGREPGLISTVSVLFMAAFGIKSALFPFFFWLPASYHTPAFAVSALFAGLLSEVGVYAMIRAFTTLFTQEVGYTHSILLVIAGFSMVTGVLGAAAQQEFRRVLAFHSVSQIGYLVMGLALFTPLALAGSIFYMMHYVIVNANLFFIAGIAHRVRGTSTLKAPGIVCVYERAPLACLVFLIAAFSLAGLPPLSGFFAKLILVRAGLEIESYVIVVTALLVGLITLFSMVKIWAEAFWKAPDATPEATPETGEGPSPARSMVTVSVGLAMLTVLIGVFANDVLKLSLRASEQLLDVDAYRRAVMGVMR